MTTPSAPRTDLGFLRRRTKPGATAAPASPAAAPVQAPAQAAAPAAAPSSGLTLGRPGSSAAPASAASPAAPAATRPSGGLVLGRPGGSTPSGSPAASTPSSAAPAATPSSTPATTRPSAGLSLGSSAGSSSGLSLGSSLSQRGPARTTAAPASDNPRAKALAAQRQQAQHEDHEVSLLFPAPGIADLYELNLVDRVLRLSPLESSVGTLLITGSSATAWESVRFVAGGRTVDGHTVGTPVMTTGNRELVGYQGRDALIALRHVRQLRRAIFMNRSSAAMGVKLVSGRTVALPPAANGAQIVLLVHRIGNVLELRAEPVPLDWPDVKIWQEFDFTMTHQAPSSTYGR